MGVEDSTLVATSLTLRLRWLLGVEIKRADQLKRSGNNAAKTQRDIESGKYNSKRDH